MINPLVDLMRRYDAVPLSAVVVTLARQGDRLSVTLVRYGGASGCESVGIEEAMRGITCWMWERLPDIYVELPGEYYRHDVKDMVRGAIRYVNALDVLQVNDGIETCWHFRPCPS